MANWITHLRIADGILELYPEISKKDYAVGNIAPDCNVENEDWTSYTPSKAITHWMGKERKGVEDADRFCKEYLLIKKADESISKEEYSFLLGYYTHLLVDASFEWFIREEKRVKAVWERFLAQDIFPLEGGIDNLDRSWERVRGLIPKRVRANDLYMIEEEYVDSNPGTTFITEIQSLAEYPNYLDYMLDGSIIRKIGIMGKVMKADKDQAYFIAVTREEYSNFINNTIHIVIHKFEEYRLLE